jgi:hypothetical protein
MANIEFNTNKIRKNPIKRNNLFYSEESFNLDVEIGKNYLETDVNQTIILYSVDLSKTNASVVYGETKKDSIIFFPPVELNVIYEIESGELRSYDKSKNVGSYIKSGKLTFGIYQSTLDERGIEIKVGDYVGVQVTPEHMEYYTVVNDGRNNFSNEMSIFGYRPSYRKVECASIDINEFKG